MFSFLKKTVSSLYASLSKTINTLFSQSSIDEETLKKLEELLIKADVGVKATGKIITHLRTQYNAGTIIDGMALKHALERELETLLAQPAAEHNASVFILLGINGSGKTTFCAKLAQRLHEQKKRVLLVAADTFRAAAPEQLMAWSEKTGADIFVGKPQQDPASVVFEGCKKFIDEQYDALIIDTAGRLQTKTNLMHELAKIKRVITKQLPDRSLETLLTLDAMLGQNSFEQARVFHEATNVSGLVLTKMDGTAKGGIALAVYQEFGIPVRFISFGEQPNDYAPFNAHEYIEGLLNES